MGDAVDKTKRPSSNSSSKRTRRRAGRERNTRILLDANMSQAHGLRAVGRALAEDPALRPTALLRRVRQSGRACEHNRFVRLFHEVRSMTHASR